MITLDKGYLSVSTNNLTQGYSAPVQRNKLSPQEHLIAVIRDNDPSGLLADSLKKKLDKDTQIINQLSAKKSSQMTKEEAQQKIARIKEQIKLLRLMVATSINPQATLRQIKQLSRELAEVSREYGAIVGADSHDTAASASSETSSTGEKESPSPANTGNEALLNEGGELFPSAAGYGENTAQGSTPQTTYVNDNKNLLKGVVEENKKKLAATEARIREHLNMADDIRLISAQLKNLYRTAVNQARQKKQYFDNMGISIQQNLSAAEKDAISITVKASFSPSALINTFA